MKFTTKVLAGAVLFATIGCGGSSEVKKLEPVSSDGPNITLDSGGGSGDKPAPPPTEGFMPD